MFQKSIIVVHWFIVHWWAERQWVLYRYILTASFNILMFYHSLWIGPIILSCVLKYPNGHEKQNSRYNESFSQSMELTNLVVLDLDNIVNDFDLYNTMDNDYSLRTMLPVFIFTISSLGKQRMTGPQWSFIDSAKNICYRVHWKKESIDITGFIVIYCHRPMIQHQTARFLPKKDSMKRILFVGGNYPYRHPEKRNTMLTILLEIIELKPETHPEKTWRIWKKRFYIFFLECSRSDREIVFFCHHWLVKYFSRLSEFTIKRSICIGSACNVIVFSFDGNHIHQ